MSHLPEYEGNDLQSRIETIRQQNQPRERIPTERELDRAIGKPGERAICAQCGKPIINTGLGFWDHVGIAKPRHIAMPKDDMPDDLTGDSGIVLPYRDAPEDEDVEQDSPTWLDDKAEELKARQWVRINDLRRPAPPLPTNVADLYRIIDEQLPTAAGKTQLKAFWMQITEDSRMLDWLEKQVHAESNNDVAVLYEAMNGKPLREAIKERMNLATPGEFERNPEMPFSLKDAGKA